MSELSVSQTQEVNAYMKTHKGVTREQAVIALFGGGAKHAQDKGLSTMQTRRK